MSALQEALEVALVHRLPVALRGRPGVGKTSMLRAAAAATQLPCEIVVGSLREPTDIAGLPVLVDGEVRLAPPAWARRAAEATAGYVVLLDELTTASPAVQAAMLRVVQESVVGELAMPESVRLIAAYNDAPDCGGYELELPMRSRLIHLNVEPRVDSFVQGLTTGWAARSTGIRLDVTGPDSSVVSRWRNTVAAFVTTRPTMLEVTPAAGSWGGFPTPRTWEMVVRSAAAAETAGASDEARDLLIAGCIGPGAAVEFLSFIANLDLPNPSALLRDPACIASCLDASRPDRAMVALLEVAHHVVSTGDCADWTASWRVAAHAAREGFGDLVAWTFRKVALNRPAGAAVPTEFADVRRFLEAA